MAGFKDWFGYDTWMPDTGKIQSMAINMEDDDTWVTYGQVEIPEDESKQPHWDYGDENVYLLEHMELTDCYPVMEPVSYTHLFTEVTEYLPQAIIAQVGEGEDWEEKNLQITNWVCTEYVQDLSLIHI